MNATVLKVEPQPSGKPRDYKQVELALLVVDIVASTQHLRRGGDDRYARLLESFKDSVSSAVASMDAVEIADTGDGFVHAFASVPAAIAAASRIFTANDERNKWRCAPLRLRAGIHKGPLVVCRYGIVGRSLYEAFELGNAAGPDELWLSATAARQASIRHGQERAACLPRSGLTPVVVLDRADLNQVSLLRSCSPQV